MKGAIQSFDVSYLLHATEDPETVSLAVREIFASDASFETEEMEGHFGNAIKKVDLHLHGDEASKAFQELTSKLPSTLRGELVRDLDKYVDEHSSLFLRLDKQKLVRGELSLGSSDVIRLKVKPRAFVMKGHGREFFTNLLGET